MVYRLSPDQPFEAAVRQIAHDHVERARAALSRRDDQAAGVHEARKAIKRLRILLRLVRSGLGDATWRQHNAALRDIAHLVAPDRDRHVVAATLERLGKTAGPRLGRALAAMARQVEEHAGVPPPPAPAPAPPKDATETAPSRTQATAALSRIAEDLARLTVPGAPADLVEDGIRATHRRGRRALAKARRQPSDEAFHELRKAVQAHWRQMQILRRLWPAMLDGRIAEASALSERLGFDHDLAMLKVKAARLARHGLAAEDVRLIRDAAGALQAADRAECLTAAERLFQAKPRRFAREMVAYWELAGAVTDGDGKSASGRSGPRARSLVRPRPVRRSKSATGTGTGVTVTAEKSGAKRRRAARLPAKH